MTSAACAAKFPPQTVRIGATNLTDGISVGVKCSKLHPLYDPTNNSYDVAVIKLQSGTTATTVTLNTNTSVPALNDEVVAIGLGLKTLLSGGIPPDMLQKLSTTYSQNSTTCAATYGYAAGAGPFLCTSSTSKGICVGDGGGPLLTTGNVQVGIASFYSPSQYCGDNAEPDGFIDVADALVQSFINDQLVSDACDITPAVTPSPTMAPTSSNSGGLCFCLRRAFRSIRSYLSG